MRLLVDTCTFVWMAAAPRELSSAARDAIVDPANEVYLSAASAWEIAIKYALGRLPLPQPPERLVPALRERHGVSTLAVDEESTLFLARLPALHRDPFDRLLVAQAITQGLTLVTPDPLVTQYPARVLW